MTDGEMALLDVCETLENISAKLSTLFEFIVRMQEEQKSDPIYGFREQRQAKQLTKREFCQQENWSDSSFYRACYDKRRGFPAHKVGGIWYVDMEKYKQWLKTDHINHYKYVN